MNKFNQKRAVITSPYGPRKRPVPGASDKHPGIDVAHIEGHDKTDGATIHSTGRGTVTNVGQQSGYGNIVEIDHHDGSGKRFYAHMKEPSPLKVGQKVDKYEPIGKVGNTGTQGMKPHLHYEHRIGTYRDTEGKIKPLRTPPSHEEGKVALDGGHWVTINGRHILIKD